MWISLVFLTKLFIKINNLLKCMNTYNPVGVLHSHAKASGGQRSSLPSYFSKPPCTDCAKVVAALRSLFIKVNATIIGKLGRHYVQLCPDSVF